MAAEVYEYMVYLSELTAHDAAADFVYGGGKAVDDTDVQDLSGFMLNLLHLERLGVIVQDDAVIVDRASALVLLNCFLRLRLDDVAEILDLRIVTLHVGRDVSRVCNTAASDHSDLDFFHIGFSP